MIDCLCRVFDLSICGEYSTISAMGIGQLLVSVVHYLRTLHVSVQSHGRCDNTWRINFDVMLNKFTCKEQMCTIIGLGTTGLLLLGYRDMAKCGASWI